jgi:L-ascorbate metabolism protein UlaG (beta-lactamase superfamily)
MKISRILHAGYVFESQGTQLLFDPIFENPFSRNCHAFPSVSFDLDRIGQLTPDAIFISHFHDDHCSFDSLHLLPRATPVYLYCLFDELFVMLRELGFTNVQALAVDVPVQVGAFEVIPRRALDDDVDSMFHIRAEGLNVLNVVDAWMDPETLEQLQHHAPWDMVLWPFQTMREVDVIAPSRASHVTPELPVALPEEWPEQLQALNPRYVVPSSCQFVQEPWSWYNHAMFPITYRQFVQAVGEWLPAAQVLRLNPSVAFELTAHALTPAAPLPWVLPLGDQDVDFEYDPAITPPPTADIARRFAALTAEQAALVLDYCQRGLLEKYAEMELPDDSYFADACVWQLTVYDHEGAGQRFRYRIHGDTIAIAGDAQAPTWTTEIPAAKLYAGLALGESLTSMYLRIAGAHVEANADADIADDPLIRCLFNDAFGAYQAAQLRRLKETA